MAEVYYYVPAEESENIVECGLKLSVWHSKEIMIEGIIKKCISALLNPKDDINKFNDEAYKCIKLDLPPDYCYVADRYLYEAGVDMPEVMELYLKSIIPLEKYIFGSYRLPECLVTTTVIPGQADLLNKAQDTPVLFNSSEELYLNNLIEFNKEKYYDFDDITMYFFYCKLSELKQIVKIEDKNRKIAVFIDNTDNGNERIYTIKIPETICNIENNSGK
ncbi:MAG TPA: hypothetical protein PK733_01180 [Clostridiales bacterium]|nr:hypothetical protein [Clostridiales bacterium]